ncbi:hypothetical protein M378DRAFT_17991 [Amanita muscaria Koide BX008]|uniref:Uncharacterized protein n=1 Tax=Amanita muscaria (strain Koide BX008) TaxID=946122 RepID=A0A0C2WFM6_AMAMK|nr:hypothetical protein M378DRAFT_17991 [Amanita muscaria Koide BX008]
MLDNLFNESGMTQEDQKIIWLQKTIPNEYFKNIMFDDFDTYASLVTKLKKINKGVERKTFFNIASIGGGTSSTKDEFAMDIRPATNADEKDIGLQTVLLKPKRDKEKQFGNKGGRGGNFRGNTGRGRGGFRGKGKGRAIRTLDEDYNEDEEEEDDEDAQQEETDMGMSIRAAIRSLPKKQRELVVADLHQKGF